MDHSGPSGMSEVTVVDTEGASAVAGVWTEVALEEEDNAVLVGSLDL